MDNVVQVVVIEHISTKSTSTSNIGRDISIDFDMEQVSSHLEKSWETFKIFQQKVTCFDVESIVKFNKDHEIGCPLRIEYDGGNIYNNPL